MRGDCEASPKIGGEVAAENEGEHITVKEDDDKTRRRVMCSTFLSSEGSRAFQFGSFTLERTRNDSSEKRLSVAKTEPPRDSNPYLARRSSVASFLSERGVRISGEGACRLHT